MLQTPGVPGGKDNGACGRSPATACEIERISDLGLDNVQQKYLHLLGGGPQRLNVLASMLGVSTKVLTKTVEPYLLRSGMVVKTDNGMELDRSMDRTT